MLQAAMSMFFPMHSCTKLQSLLDLSLQQLNLPSAPSLYAASSHLPALHAPSWHLRLLLLEAGCMSSGLAMGLHRLPACPLLAMLHSCTASKTSCCQNLACNQMPIRSTTHLHGSSSSVNLQHLHSSSSASLQVSPPWHYSA